MVTGVLFPVAVITIIIYSVHKKRKCARKDKRSKYIILPLFDNSGVNQIQYIYIYIYFFFFASYLKCCMVLFRCRLM